MKKKEKRMILILIIITIIVIGVVYAFTRPEEEENNPGVQVGGTEENTEREEFVQQLEDGSKVNISAKLSEKKVINGLEVSNIRLTMRNGQTYLLADVTNNSGKAIDVTSIDITLVDKQGNEITTIGGVINPMQNGETTQLESSTTLDFANAYDFRITIL